MAGTTSTPGVRSSKGSAPTAIGPVPGPVSPMADGPSTVIDRRAAATTVGRTLEAPRAGLDRQPGGHPGGDESGAAPQPGEPVGPEDVEQIVDLARGEHPGAADQMAE